jgi:hypothetical protein
MPSVLPKIVASMARQTVEAFDLATELHHPGESGRAREEAIRRFLANIVPPDFGIDTGFVIDAVGGISRQVDIVVFRKQRAPVLEIGGVKHFMVESVAAVIETKASIQAVKRLTDALDNIESVKQLDRTNQGRNLVVGPGVQMDPELFQNQIWGGIVAGASMAYLGTLDAIIDWIEQRPRARWPNAYVDLHDFFVQYVFGTVGDSAPTKRGSDPMSAQGLGGVQQWDHAWGIEPTLALFGVELLNFLRVTPLIQFDAYGYFHSAALPMPEHYRFPDGFGAG